jgi:predicted metal-dependent phosphoesterase TrpH
MSRVLRADLHVHTCHSRVSGTLPILGSRDCYSSPLRVYEVAKARGMDLVAITDHDEITGALELLDARPDADDVIVGEEVSCWLPDSRIEVHLGVYGMTEALHRDLQPLRRNAFDVLARLREADVFFALNHLLHFYRGQIPLDAYLRLLDEVPALEVRNGTMVPAHNALVEAIAGGTRGGRTLAMIGGSDAHTLRRVGTTWTEAPGSTREDFVASLRAGLGRPGGVHGGTGAVAADAYGVVGSYIAALAGFGPRDLTGLRRAACLTFAVVSSPFQFMPWLVAFAGKSREARVVAEAEAFFAGRGTVMPAFQAESEA